MKFRILAMISAAVAMTFTAMASEPADEMTRVSVEWQNPEDFTDLKPTNSPRKRFRERTMEKFEKYFDELAQELPEGQALKLKVTDVDLAGQVWPGHFYGLNSANDVRIVEDIYIPRMDFNYELVDASGAILKSGDIKLKDMNFLFSNQRRNETDPLRYEKRMYKKWFDEEIVSQ